MNAATILKSWKIDWFEGMIAPVCFCVADAREAISGDAELARRFDEMTLTRWSSTPAFEELMISILRNLPLREPSVLAALSLRRILQITDGPTARIFRLMNDLAVAAVESRYASADRNDTDPSSSAKHAASSATSFNKNCSTSVEMIGKPDGLI